MRIYASISAVATGFGSIDIEEDGTIHFHTERDGYSSNTPYFSFDADAWDELVRRVNVAKAENAA